MDNSMNIFGVVFSVNSVIYQQFFVTQNVIRATGLAYQFAIDTYADGDKTKPITIICVNKLDDITLETAGYEKVDN